MNKSPWNKNNSNDLILVNIAETVVREKTLELIKTMDMCQCEKCYLNACAIVLNSVKPLYVTTPKGALLSEILTINIQYQTDLTFDIIKALKIVCKSPRH